MARLHSVLTDLPSAWLRAHAPDVARALAADGEGPTVQRAQQRALLQAVAERGGEAAVLGLGRGRLDRVDEPLVYVLLNSASVAALIDKEQRLNRFFHSTHRVRVLELGAGVLELQHESDQGAPPQRLESLFVLGLHLALLAEIGCVDLAARLPASAEPEVPVFGDGRARATLPAGDATRWRLTWRHFEPRRAWSPGLDAVLQRASAAPDLERPTSASEGVERLVARDFAHRWTLDEVARRLARSKRTLQRELAAEGTTLSRAIEDARLAQAERMLRDPACSITAIGYTCGFADTAHFSRRFKARRGCSPSAWRDRQG